MELKNRQVKIDASTDLNQLGEAIQNAPNLEPQAPEEPKPIDIKPESISIYENRYNELYEKYIQYWDTSMGMRPKEVTEELEFLENFLKRNIEQKYTNPKVKEWLKLAKIDPLEKIERPPICLSIIDGESEGIIGTLGNFSLIIGKAKSKKTFSLSLFLSALVANQTVFGKFKGSLPENKTKVVFFDTEQSRYHVQKFYHRVCGLLGIENPVNFEAYCLRQYTPSERLEIIDFYIQSDPDIGFVAIDGIRDLVSSINDEDEATKTASHLLKWTETKSIHIVTVLHQNKRDENARGHLGTELVNKAETVLSVSLDPQDRKISVVEPEFCRDREPEIFAFTVDENGLPVLVEGWELSETKSKKTLSPQDIADEYHTEKLRSIFKDLGDQIKGGEMADRIKTLFEIGDSRAKEFRTYYLAKNWIIRNGHPNSRNLFYTLNLS